MLSNAYGSELTDKKAIGYYNNNEKNSIKKLGVNVFESTFFTRNNTNIMIKQNTIKIIIDVIIWLVIVLLMKDKNIVLCITQSIFSSEILISYFKLLYFNNKSYTQINKLKLMEYIINYLHCLLLISILIRMNHNY